MTLTATAETRPAGYLVDPRALTPVSTGFCSHLETYPTYMSTKNAFYALPLTKRTVNLIRGPVRYVRMTNPIKFFVDRGDSFADKTLSQVDRLVPALKTVEFRDVFRPLRAAPANPAPAADPVSNSRPAFSWRRRSNGATRNAAGDGLHARGNTTDHRDDDNHDGDHDHDHDNNGCAVAAFVEKVWTRHSVDKANGGVQVAAAAPISAIDESHATRN